MVHRRDVTFRLPPQDPSHYLIAMDLVSGTWSGCSPDLPPYAASFRAKHSRPGLVIVRVSLPHLRDLVRSGRTAA